MTTSSSGYDEFSRTAWRSRAVDADGAGPIAAPTGERVPAAEVADIYGPLADLVRDRMAARPAGVDPRRPFVLGIAGSVAAGKSTAARLVRALLAAGPGGTRVEHVTTDGFLWPNAVLEARGIMTRKGFPESYDNEALAAFLAALRAGATEVRAPRYSHDTYDVVVGDEIVVREADVVIVEGVNVLQPALAGSDGESLDFAVFVDAAEADLERWYVERLFGLREAAVADPGSYFGFLVGRTDEEVREFARGIWHGINLVNLREHIVPTRSRAHVILEKGPDHAVRRVRVRRPI